MQFIKTVFAAVIILSVFASSQLRQRSQDNNYYFDTMLASGSNDNSITRVQILAVNDFHGQISTGRKVAGRPAGSAPVLISYLREEERQFNGVTIFAHTGDFIGASAPQSALLQDEPAIMMFNTLVKIKSGNTQPPEQSLVNVLGIPGNHEFDEGTAEFFRMLKGGNHAKGSFLQNPYKGALFPYICVNILDSTDNKPILPPYLIKNIKGTRIAFIGATHRETPSLVTPGNVAGLRFTDEVTSINAAVATLKQMKIQTIIVLIHQGGTQNPYQGPTNITKKQVTGSIAGLISRMDGEVDVVLTGHTHSFTNTNLPAADGSPVLVVQGLSAGTAYSDVELAIDCSTGEVVEKVARVVTTWADTAFHLSPDPQAVEIVASTENKLNTQLNQALANTMTNISRWQNNSGESALGDLVADAQRTALNCDFAIVNMGSIRAEIDTGVITWGECFAVQPFGNKLYSIKLTGLQLTSILNEQWIGGTNADILQIAGFSYSWDNSRPAGDRIVEILRNNIPVYPDSIYSVAVNKFLACGGARFKGFLSGKQNESSITDTEALISYVRNSNPSINASINKRITGLSSTTSATAFHAADIKTTGSRENGTGTGG